MHYMTAARRLINQIDPRLLHVTCTAHLFHNCTEKVRAHFSDVDNLIARVKSAVVKNKDRKELFAVILLPLAYGSLAGQATGQATGQAG